MGWNFVLNFLSTLMIIASIWRLSKMIKELNKKYMLGANRGRLRLNPTATIFHIAVLIIVVLTSFFQLIYVIAGFNSP
jgi:hypothetical protein